MGAVEVVAMTVVVLDPLPRIRVRVKISTCRGSSEARSGVQLQERFNFRSVLVSEPPRQRQTFTSIQVRATVKYGSVCLGFFF